MWQTIVNWGLPIIPSLLRLTQFFKTNLRYFLAESCNMEIQPHHSAHDLFAWYNECSFGSCWKICSMMCIGHFIIYTPIPNTQTKLYYFSNLSLNLGINKNSNFLERYKFNPWKIICCHKYQKVHSEISFIKSLHVYIKLSTDYLVSSLQEMIIMFRFIKYINMKFCCHLWLISSLLPKYLKKIQERSGSLILLQNETHKIHTFTFPCSTINLDYLLFWWPY